MPRKTPKPRKSGPVLLQNPKAQRIKRPQPQGVTPVQKPTGPQRDKRFDRRPPKFPGRLGGR